MPYYDEPRSPRRPGPIAYIVAAAVILAVIAGAIALGRATFLSYSTQPNNVALAYNDGPIANRTYDKLIPAGTREAQGFGDVAFSYPTDQRDWDFEGREDGSSDAPPFRIVVKGIGGQGTAEIRQPGVSRFLLETEEATLRTFHEELGLRYGAYANEEGELGQGWQATVLPKYHQTPLQRVMQQVASEKEWTVDQLYLDPDLRIEWQNEVVARMPQATKNAVESKTQFFTGFVLDLGTPILPDNIRANLDAEQTALSEARKTQTENAAKAASTTANLDVEVAKANAERDIARAKAEAKKAEADGYGGPELYLEHKMAEKGLNSRQPTIVAPGVAPAQ